MNEALTDDDRPARRVDEVLTVQMRWFLDEVVGKRRRRLQAATAELRECIELHGEGVMDDEDLRLLQLERQFFGPEGAVGRVAPAPVLLPPMPQAPYPMSDTCMPVLPSCRYRMSCLRRVRASFRGVHCVTAGRPPSARSKIAIQLGRASAAQSPSRVLHH